MEVGSNRKHRISKRMLKDENADEFRRRREQCEAIASIASAGPFPKLTALAMNLAISALSMDVTVSGETLFLSAMVCNAEGEIRRERWVGMVVPRTEAPCSCHLVRKSTAEATEMDDKRGSSIGFLGFKSSLRSPAEK